MNIKYIYIYIYIYIYFRIKDSYMVETFALFLKNRRVYTMS